MKKVKSSSNWEDKRSEIPLRRLTTTIPTRATRLRGVLVEAMDGSPLSTRTECPTFTVFFSVLLLCLASSAAGRSCHRKVPNVVRDQILRFHNDLRARLARGEVDGANGKLKPAKNMYELEWDCDLEYKAQKRCKDGWIDTNLLYNNGVVSDIVIG
ncbi:hypothetical protein Y032_0428g1293 [Ancylostoma ceylanicum]|uniref:SCP domain-containing protein n=1 Tax=Ancylostoma ceylanicum TaxID=53326 RepID=A0A016X035_9BILA|nr:hypothetical protein Y032_0428g1293 [Ancylostoma ceylanicum]